MHLAAIILAAAAVGGAAGADAQHDQACIAAIVGGQPKLACLVEVRHGPLAAVEATCKVSPDVANRLKHDCGR